jgi:ribonuclease J
MTDPAIKVIPLGGLGEIGKNCTVLEYDGNILVIDVGLMFPEDAMLGVDMVIPDFRYLLAHRTKCAGIVLTHGLERITSAHYPT